MRWSAAVAIISGPALPLYNQFLHGPRYAASILSRGAAYSEAHMVGAMISLLLMFDVVAIYLAIAERASNLGLVAFMIALFAQAGFAGVLFVDGVLNPLLAYFDAPTQTNLHSASFNSTAGHDYLAHLYGPAIYTVDAILYVYLIGFELLGLAVVRANVLPRAIGILLMAGSLPVAFALMLPQWLETLGYAAIGLAIAWAGVLVWRDSARALNEVRR